LSREPALVGAHRFKAERKRRTKTPNENAD